MTVRSMTMRATVTRQITTPFSTFGQTTTTVVSSDQVCFVQGTTSRKRYGGGIFHTITEIIGLFPLGADVAREDRLTIADRRGVVLFSGLRIKSLTPPRESHVEYSLSGMGNGW